MDVSLLDNGRMLVSLSQPPQVVELDRTGRVVWSLAGTQHMSTARRLENGNTLVAESGGAGRAVEYDASGAIAWERAGLQLCYSAERLPDGSTLVGDAKGVREIAPDGTERWLLKTNALCRATRY